MTMLTWIGLFVGGTVVGTFVLTIWVFWMMLRGVYWGISSLTGVPRRGRSSRATLRCPQYRCGALNLTEARYCRRCGANLKPIRQAQWARI